MDSLFDIFFEHKIESLERCGLKTRQNRTDVIDHLNAVISGYAEGESLLLFLHFCKCTSHWMEYSTLLSHCLPPPPPPPRKMDKARRWLARSRANWQSPPSSTTIGRRRRRTRPWVNSVGHSIAFDHKFPLIWQFTWNADLCSPFVVARFAWWASTTMCCTSAWKWPGTGPSRIVLRFASCWVKINRGAGKN